MSRGPLTGSPFDPAADPLGTGAHMEPANVAGVAARDGASPDVPPHISRGAPGVTGSDMSDGAAIGDPNPAGAHDNASEQVRDLDTLSAFDGLRAFRLSNPHVPIMVPPRAYCLLLVPNVSADFAIPSGAIAMRVSWPSSQTNTIWMSFENSAKQPSSSQSNLSAATNANAGLICNPSQDMLYYVKDKLQVSFTTGGSFFVSLQFWF